MAATTIDGVIAQLDGVIDRARREQDRNGFFATLYRGVTVSVRDGIRAGRFEDGARMEHFDVLFANRYLDALDRYRRKQPTSRCWTVTFKAATAWQPLILQHLLLGMNAHINFDLGVAAAQAAPGVALPALKRDFDSINGILGSMLDDVQRKIARVSPWLGMLDRVGGRTDEVICTFCIDRSRDVAWQSAMAIAGTHPSRMQGTLDRMDATVAALAGPIRNPGPYIGSAMLAIRMRETGDVARVLDALN